VARWSELFEPVVTCESVVSEGLFLLRDSGLSIVPLLDLFERGIVRVHFDLETQFADGRRLLRKYADQPMSLADACLVRMAELTEHSQVFTTDRDFRVYRRHGRREIPLLSPF
jgi:predicted nucleic acid-binding protein